MYALEMQPPAWSRTVRLAAIAQLLTACITDAPNDPGEVDVPDPKFDVPVPYATVGDRLGIWNGSEYQPFFIKGINLGGAVPGTQAGELAATREQYRHWFEQMGELGVNALRVYTLHYPRFYEELARHNIAHPDSPLYVLHGAWLDEENASGDLYDLTAQFEESMREVVDCAHGDCDIEHRYGRAYGSYRADISQWILGWIVGREIAPDEVALTNANHAEDTRYEGTAFSLASGRPLERWFVERIDWMTMRERQRYGVERPISVSSWPTLDPLHHPSEAEASYEDEETLDLAEIDASGAPAGYFASYHAYPYYPDFMTRDPAYQGASDREGPNPYMGYLRDLKQHYAKLPLLIAEFGIPTSWGNAHFGAAGMNHGGQDEVRQGEQAARLLHDVFDAGCAGGAFFAWIDEWWKPTWIVDELALPRERYKLWHNVTSPEPNYGLIAFDPPPPNFAGGAPTLGQGRVRSIQEDANAAFFFVRVDLSESLADGETLTLGLDTYGDEVGESVLPSGTVTTRRNEFSLQIIGPATAQLYVTRAYDLFGIWHNVSTSEQLFHSVASDAAAWVLVRWRNNASVPPGTPNPDNIDEIGRFSVQRVGDPPSSHDAVALQGTRIDVKIPWTLLQFTDPSTLSVMDDDRSTRGRETTISQGIAVGAQIGDDLLETTRFAWAPWEAAPPTTERAKPSLGLFADACQSLP
jgi:hypothetical protein